MVNDATKEEFWACTLSKQSPVYTFEPSSDEDVEHKLQINSACLGQKAKPGERNLVQVTTEDDDGKSVQCDLLSLKLGQIDFCHCEFGFRNKTTLKLKQGGGPISLAGIHLQALPIDFDEEDEDELASSEDESADLTIDETVDEVAEEEDAPVLIPIKEPPPKDEKEAVTVTDKADTPEKDPPAEEAPAKNPIQKDGPSSENQITKPIVEPIVEPSEIPNAQKCASSVIIADVAAKSEGKRKLSETSQSNNENKRKKLAPAEPAASKEKVEAKAAKVEVKAVPEEEEEEDDEEEDEEEGEEEGESDEEDESDEEMPSLLDGEAEEESEEEDSEEGEEEEEEEEDSMEEGESDDDEIGSEDQEDNDEDDEEEAESEEDEKPVAKPVLVNGKGAGKKNAKKSASPVVPDKKPAVVNGKATPNKPNNKDNASPKKQQQKTPAKSEEKKTTNLKTPQTNGKQDNKDKPKTPKTPGQGGPKKSEVDIKALLLKSPNLPKKKDKFINFVKSSYKLTDEKVQEELWDYVQKNKK